MEDWKRLPNQPI